MTTIPTFPARPVNGGRLDLAPPKRGRWFVEPKYNGWRTLVHAPTGTMFNRHGERLTIDEEFTEALSVLHDTPFEWVDCEALERRHAIGKGSLIVLDIVQQHGTYTERRAWMEKHFMVDVDPMLMRNGRVYLAPYSDMEHAANIWGILKRRNEILGVEFYEGVVMKRADSIYPFQLRNSKEETRDWVKHRWEF